MKKLLSALLLIVLMIPMIVKADTIYTHTYYNDNVMVGGEVVVNLKLYYDTNYSFEITYDSSMLKTSKDMINIAFDKTLIYDEKTENTVEETNPFDVNVENEKVTINTSMKAPHLLDDYDGGQYLTIRFVAVKEGTTTIDFAVKNGKVLNNPVIKITKSDDCSSISCPEVKECNTEEKECNCPKQDCDCPTSSAKDDSNSNNSILTYCSLGLNALLLIALIIVVITKKKQSTVAKSNPQEEKPIKENNE